MAQVKPSRDGTGTARFGPRPCIFAQTGAQCRSGPNPMFGGTSMNQGEGAATEEYPHGRGYGQDYMRGGEVQGGYGYAEREEYERRRGELDAATAVDPGSLPRLDGGQEPPLPS